VRTERLRLLVFWILPLLVFGPSSALPAAAESSSSFTHVIQPGDTVGELAERYGIPLQSIVLANGLRNPDVILVGDLLVIPLTSDLFTVKLPHPLSSLDAPSVAPVQGQTWTLHVRGIEPFSVAGSFDGQALHWIPGETSDSGSEFWALVPIHALAQPGLHTLVLRPRDSYGHEEELGIDIPVRAGEFDSWRIVLSAATSQLLEPKLVRGEAEMLAEIWSLSAPQPLWEGRFERPVHSVWPISSPFGQRRAYNDGPTNGYHSGVDFSAKQGALVRAPAAGTVVLADGLTVRGNAVILDHGAGVHTGYYHLWEILAERGATVEKGDVLGRVGSSGLSTGAHLHWELRVGNVAVDPLQWTAETVPQKGLLSREQAKGASLEDAP
jgi:murein DD-endopeptidase MepM/ murein hydrolase activator NlpD